MPKIFISYTKADQPWAEWIAWTLKESGHVVYFDAWEISGGANIIKWMTEKHDAADHIVCVCTPEYFNDNHEYAAMEREAAIWKDPRGEKGLVRFVVVKKCEIQSLFAPLSRLYLTDLSLQDAKQRLIKFFLPAAPPDSEPPYPGTDAAVGGGVSASASNEPTFPGSKPPPPKIIDLSALPDTSLVQLRGRDDDLARLDAAWADPKIHVLSVVAWGGQGKTALVSTWVDRLRAEGGRGAEALLAWSFYSQGSKERAATADRFLDWALKKLGLPDPGPSATLKAEKISEALQSRRVLLILDGVEPLQHGPGPQEGLLKDPAMRALLRRAAADGVGGLILLTTRLAVEDIAGRRNRAAPVLDLSELSDEAGAALLEDRDVHGPARELRAAAREFGGHALALTLLAGFLVKRHGGDVYRRDRIGAMVAAERILNPIHAHARRVMKSMDEEWLSDAPLHAAIMRVIGLFDRPASGDCLEALRRPPAPPGLEAWQQASHDARSEAIFELREAGLLLRADEHAPDSLDAHPLAREWYGERFRSENEAGFKAAHSRLYDHLRRTTREGDPPKDVAALEPLFQTIAHGCKAGRQQKTLADVYKNRICRRRPDGRLVFHAQDALGAIGPCLAALAWFFDKPFETPHAGLNAEDRSWVLGEAARFLGYLGRLGEARDTQRASLELAVTAQDWANATRRAVNLVEAEWTLGDIATAIVDAERGANFADKGLEEFVMLVGRTYHAHARAAAGEDERARALFDDAEARQKKLEPQRPRLYSLGGAQLCDLLLGEGRLAEVAERGAYALAIAERQNWVLDVGLDNSSLGRAALGLALAVTTAGDAAPHLVAARKHLDIAITELRRSNMGIFIPLGYLARARLRRAEGDFAGAHRDLDEVLEIAEPGPMRLHLCDMHLELCRLALAQRDGFAPLSPSPPPAATGEARDKLTQTARDELGEASKLIRACGYHKRDAERDELNQVLDGKRLFCDLPIHV
ncbi:MAG: TIR domain-containing protein [Methylocystis sp.]